MTLTAPARRDLLRRFGLHGIGLGLALAGCANLGGPSVVTLGQADLNALMGRAFPVQKRVLELIDVTLSAPSLQLLPERNRIAVVLALASQERVFGLAGRGRLDFDSALRYEPRDATLRLTQVRVQQLTLEGGLPQPPAAAASAASGSSTTSSASSPAANRLARLGSALAERALDELVLYTVPAERLASLRQLGLQPGAVTVTARGVEITLARSP